MNMIDCLVHRYKNKKTKNGKRRKGQKQKTCMQSYIRVNREISSFAYSKARYTSVCWSGQAGLGSCCWPSNCHLRQLLLRRLPLFQTIHLLTTKHKMVRTLQTLNITQHSKRYTHITAPHPNQLSTQHRTQYSPHSPLPRVAGI